MRSETIRPGIRKIEGVDALTPCELNRLILKFDCMRLRGVCFRVVEQVWEYACDGLGRPVDPSDYIDLDAHESTEILAIVAALAFNSWCIADERRSISPEGVL